MSQTLFSDYNNIIKHKIKQNLNIEVYNNVYVESSFTDKHYSGMVLVSTLLERGRVS